ncbi:hypothetical protein [Sphingobium yanoikuyae]|uniref:hypothetical protein n=1 Tax=Sphingobium yanoikuyae TaxID=13690 RepID=UPI0013790311|nr:hypothetical protein [Sphingobium yanoikuyae]NBB37649.1 hypothetical protein [Sphingobium yanoikuyae]
MKFVKLRTSAHVNGELRHPHEGVLHVTNEEAERLFENESADDVTADFDEEQDAAAPKDTVTTAKTPPKASGANKE